MELIRPADWKVTPWRSGRGETAEIAVFPGNAGLSSGAFDWRVSLAVMSEDAQFSAFPGYDRILTVVKGEGLTLDAGPEAPCLEAEPLSPVLFPGEHALTGRLRGGPVRNLNLMLARNKARGTVYPRAFGAGGLRLSGTATAVVLLLLEGAKVRVIDRKSGAEYRLEAMETLLHQHELESGFDLEIISAAPCSLIAMEIRSGSV